MASGRILVFFALLLYFLVTLIPDLHSPNLILTPHLIAFPFVLWWQGGLVLMVVLFLLRLYPQDRNFYLFGQGVDRWVLALIALVIISSLVAEFKNQAIWQGGILLSFITIGYSLWQHLKITEKPISLLKLQGLLQLAYIFDSLVLWFWHRFLPYVNQLANLNKEGIKTVFDLSSINLHNDLPSGDSNYVAGYLILALPLLFILGLTEKGLWQTIGFLGFILGLIDLYLTSSWAGFIGFGVMTIGFLIFLFLRSRLTLGASILSIMPLLFIGLSNSYIRSVLVALISGQSHQEFIYRSIAHATGIAIIKSNWLLGAGIGSTPLLYQKFRPEWAFNQAEMDFQLHSLPLQVFSELGIGGLLLILWGISLGLGFILRLKHQYQIYRDSLLIAIISYGALSFFDYQLDVIGISISLLIYIITLFYTADRSEKIFPFKYRKLNALFGWFLLLGGVIWLTPINMAWYLSSQAFLQLRPYQNSELIPDRVFNDFKTKLIRAQEFAPWETYYSNQIAWHLGKMALDDADQNVSQKNQTLALEFFQKSIQGNPYQEFSYHQAAWILNKIGGDAKALPLFEQALTLLPHRASLNFGRGLTLLRQGKNDEGIQSIVQECFYHPLFITSPLWRSQQLQGLYASVMTELGKLYQTQKQDLNLAVLNWWLGKPGAIGELRSVKQPIASLLADIIEDKRERLQKIIEQPTSAREMVISAWYNPSKRKELLNKAWILRVGVSDSNQSIVEALSARMNNSNSFDQFLRSPLPLFTPLNQKEHRQRLGFGIMSRHIDGPDPYDLFVIEENRILAQFWLDLFPEPSFVGSK